MINHSLGRLVVIIVLFLVSFTASAEEAKTKKIVNLATQAVNNFSNDPDMKWFRDNMKKAKGILILPQQVKAGFFIGGSGGSGVLLIQTKGQTWSDPAFYTMGSGTIGFQIGGEVSEIILMIMTERGVDSLLTSSFKLGGDTSVAAGPVGAGAKAQTVDVLAFSRTKGVYAGINLEGAVIKIRDKYNAEYYGKPTTPREILIEHTATNPHADKLRNAVANLAIISGGAN